MEFLLSLVIAHTAVAYAPTHEEVETKEKGIKEILVEELGPNHPLIEVARCESGFRQFENGNPLKSHYGTEDYGVFQINTTYHLKNSKKMGIDIMTVEGNLAYARYLYEKNGLRDWKPSESCWGKLTTTK